MAQPDHEPTASRQAQAADELDRQLDAALARYAAIEPRAGLEERVLANLRVQPTPVVNRAWWRGGLALAATAIVIVTVTLSWRSGKPSEPAITNRPSVAVPSQKAPETQAANPGGNVVWTGHKRIGNAHRHRSQPEALAAANPKLDQFPSPRPLSDQEKMLVSYISNDPERAALVAEARMDSLRRDREEELQEAGSDRDRDSQPQ
jgi:hypothetical protein